MIDIQTFNKFCHLLSYKYNVSYLGDSGIKICITKIIFVLLQQLCQEAQINSFQLNGHKNDFKITASDKEKKTYLTLLTLILNFAINLFYISLSFWQPRPTKILGKNIHPTQLSNQPCLWVQAIQTRRITFSECGDLLNYTKQLIDA